MNLLMNLIEIITNSLEALGPYMNLISALASGVLAVSYLPQIYSLYKTKITTGISPSFWYILDLSLLLLFIMALYQGVVAGEWGLAFAQGLNLVLALIVTGQIIYYNNKNDASQNA